jgi:hypothetical protein
MKLSGLSSGRSIPSATSLGAFRNTVNEFNFASSNDSSGIDESKIIRNSLLEVIDSLFLCLTSIKRIP